MITISLENGTVISLEDTKPSNNMIKLPCEFLRQKEVKFTKYSYDNSERIKSDENFVKSKLNDKSWLAKIETQFLNVYCNSLKNSADDLRTVYENNKEIVIPKNKITPELVKSYLRPKVVFFITGDYDFKGSNTSFAIFSETKFDEEHGVSVGFSKVKMENRPLMPVKLIHGFKKINRDKPGLFFNCLLELLFHLDLERISY